MQTVFVLQHVRPADTCECENVKMIGVYRSRASALLAIERMRTQPGFIDHPGLYDPDSNPEMAGFCIDEYELDTDHWVGGFVLEA